MQADCFRVVVTLVRVNTCRRRRIQAYVVVSKPAGKLQLRSFRGERSHMTEQVQLLVGQSSICFVDQINGGWGELDWGCLFIAVNSARLQIRCLLAGASTK